MAADICFQHGFPLMLVEFSPVPKLTLCCAGNAAQIPSLQRQINMLGLEAASLVSGIRAGPLRIAERRR